MISKLQLRPIYTGTSKLDGNKNYYDGVLIIEPYGENTSTIDDGCHPVALVETEFFWVSNNAPNKIYEKLTKGETVNVVMDLSIEE